MGATRQASCSMPRTPSAEDMQAAATDLGYPETAFLTPTGEGTFDVRYFSPMAEVPFCRSRHDRVRAWPTRSDTVARRCDSPRRVGLVELVASAGSTGPTATLTTVTPPHVDEISPMDLDDLLGLLRWSVDDLDPALPLRVAFAGGHHPDHRGKYS